MQLRSGQKLVLQSLTQGKNVGVVFPTGYGKSLCYQWPALHWQWKVLVVSPLLSLIQDQSERAHALGIDVSAYAGGMSSRERRNLDQRIFWRDRPPSLVFLSAEKLWVMLRDQSKIEQKKFFSRFNLVVFDEAHTLLEWAAFRESFSKILSLVSDAFVARQTRCLLTSATLTKVQAKDLQTYFPGRWTWVRLGPHRSNIAIFVDATQSRAQKIVNCISALRWGMKRGGVCLVYCSSRSRSEELARFLMATGFQASAYHAGICKQRRAAVLTEFKSGSTSVVCATSAFGLGIDHPSVRLVVHFDLPRSVAQFTQEIGRAGRDGKPARSLAFASLSDLDRSAIEIERRSSQTEALCETQETLDLWRFILQKNCRSIWLQTFYGARSKKPCGVCDNCLGGSNSTLNWLQPLRARADSTPWWWSHSQLLDTYIEPKIISHLKKCFS